MAKPAYKTEQVWLRAFLEDQDEICFEMEAQRSMARHGVNISDVMHVLRTGAVTRSERDYCGAVISVLGRNCDEEEILVEARMVSEMMHVSVVNVKRILKA
jgi:hypothetical protein